MKPALVLSCEHYGNRIPEEALEYFLGAEDFLHSHRGYDIGAAGIFNQLKDAAAFSFYTDISRLLVECNRSQHHPLLFSKWTKVASRSVKEKWLSLYYTPYRAKVEDCLRTLFSQNSTPFHISVHTFTPHLNGEERMAEIGLLYDPKRETERSMAYTLKKELRSIAPEIKVKMNYPYLGVADGFPTALRKKYPWYAGIELEVRNTEAENEKVRDNLYAVFNSIF